MTKHNKWTHGDVYLALPPLPDGFRGASACLLFNGVFDTQVGEEVYIAILEASDVWDDLLGRELPGSQFKGEKGAFSLICKSGIARTSAGVMAFNIWQFYREGTRIAWWEQYLNPFEFDTIRLLSSAGQQDYMKAVCVASDTGETRDFIEFENGFRLGELASTLAQVIGHEKQGNFVEVQEAFLREFSVQDLLGG